MKKKELLITFVLAVLVTGLSSGFFWIFLYDWYPPGYPLRYMRLVGEGVPEGFVEIDVLIPAVDRVRQLPFMVDFFFWFLVLAGGWLVMKKLKICLISLLFIGIVTAGGVVWKEGVKPTPSPTPIMESLPIVSPSLTGSPGCEPIHDPCSDIYDSRWYYSVEKMECYQPHSQCEGSSFVTKKECEQHCLTTTKPILNGTWKLVAYKNLVSGEIEIEPESIGRSIIIEFKDDGKRGQLQGHTIANTVRGDYEIVGSNKIKVSRFGGSKVGEGWTWGYKFWDAIRQTSSYQIKGNSLLLYFNNDKELMEFVKQ